MVGSFSKSLIAMQMAFSSAASGAEHDIPVRPEVQAGLDAASRDDMVIHPDASPLPDENIMDQVSNKAFQIEGRLFRININMQKIAEAGGDYELAASFGDAFSRYQQRLAENEMLTGDFVNGAQEASQIYDDFYLEMKTLARDNPNFVSYMEADPRRKFSFQLDSLKVAQDGQEFKDLVSQAELSASGHLHEARLEQGQVVPNPVQKVSTFTV